MHRVKAILVELLMLTLTASCNGEFLRVCYITTTSPQRTDDIILGISNNTDISLCTHVVLGFAGINTTDSALIPPHEDDDTSEGRYDKLVKLRGSNPRLKLLLAIGGERVGPHPFNHVVSDASRLGSFCDNVISYIRDIRFDGVVIHWEWPTDKEKFSGLIQTLRTRIDNESSQSGIPPMTLAAGVAAVQDAVDTGYEVTTISSNLDFLFVMTFNMDTGQGSKLRHHSPLYSRPSDPVEKQTFSVDYMVNYWLNKGAPRQKVVLGLPLYGRSYSLVTPALTDLYDAANGTSTPVPYNVLCGYVGQAGWTLVRDNVSMVPHIYNSHTWIGYDDAHSLGLKAEYIRHERLGGAMIWTTEQDDVGGTFCNYGTFPLLNRISLVLTESKDECQPGSYGSVTEAGCTKCPKGKYQPLSRRVECRGCPGGSTTYTEGADAMYKCVDTCPLGQEYNYHERQCEKCRLGFTRSNLSSAYCVKCPQSYTTMTTGDTSCVPLPGGISPADVFDINYHFTLTFTTTSCDNPDVILGAISDTVLRVVSGATYKWPGLCSGGCTNVRTLRVEGCGSGDGARRDIRRRRNSDRVQLTVRSLLENIPEEIRSSPDRYSATITRTADSVIAELFYNKELFDSLKVYGIHYLGMTERTIEILCRKTGHIFYNDQCVPCPVGNYMQRSTRRCVLCPVGQYQNEVAQTQCKSCPGPKNTTQKGTVSSDLCLSPCTVDDNYCENNGECQWREESLKVFCQCTGSYYGKRCHMYGDPNQEDLGPIIGGVLGALGTLVVVATVMVVCYLYLRRKSKSHRDTESLHERDDVMYVTGVMSNDFLPTPTVIAAEPYYYSDNVILTNMPRNRNNLRSDTFKSPTITTLDSDSSDEDHDAANKTKDEQVTTSTEEPYVTIIDNNDVQTTPEPRIASDLNDGIQTNMAYQPTRADEETKNELAIETSGSKDNEITVDANSKASNGIGENGGGNLEVKATEPVKNENFGFRL